MEIGNRIRSYRQEAGYTQKKAAKQLGVTQTYLSFVENGHYKLSVDLAAKLADLYGVTLDQIVNGTETKT